MYIPSIYLQVESVMRYRALNLLAFRKIMRKFLDRCACDRLHLQQCVLHVDRLIVKSNVAQPTIDLRGMALELIAIYGTVFKLNYEDAVKALAQYCARTGLNTPRILPHSHAFYFTNVFPHHERAGEFALRVLAGSVSLFTSKMITEVLQCSPMPDAPCCGRFANGEISVHLPVAVRGDDVFLVQSMAADPERGLSNADTVMELVLMIHASQLAGAARITAVVPYLAYTRNVASMAALAEVIECMKCHGVITVDMVSDQV
uniref:Ribose-phosphate pyrophosphokinase n=1 Tax=Lygus hesperus TaxID=30085 RepID=A0A0A9XT37_LYGHE